MTQKQIKLRWIWSLLIVVCAVALDQWTKWLAVVYLKQQDAFVIWKDVFELHYLENHGAAFGILQNQRWFFMVSGVVVVLLIG